MTGGRVSLNEAVLHQLAPLGGAEVLMKRRFHP
jgi:hypothetical protein